MYKIDLIAAWTSSHEGSSLFICEISEAGSASYNKIRSMWVCLHHWKEEYSAQVDIFLSQCDADFGKQQSSFVNFLKMGFVIILMDWVWVK